MEILSILNPWWKSGAIGKELAPPYRRKAFAQVSKLTNMRQITIITGMRRVGKSTIMFQLVEELLKETKPKNILYFSFDEKTEEPLTVLEKYAELSGVDWKKEKCFIFFDEAQKLENWSDKLKIIYDHFPNLKITVSGSSSFQLEKEAKVNLAGRHFVINVQPLSFEEYLELKGSKVELSKSKLWGEEIKNEFESYLARPFPELVNFQELSLIKSYIKDNVVEKVLRIDLSKRFRHVNEELLTRLIDIIYSKPGVYLNYDDLSKELKIGKTTLLQHFYYLEFAYVIRIVKNFRPSARTTSRKLQRAYPFHWALELGWTGRTGLETIVASILDAKYYWRDKEKEVDFLVVGKEIKPFEVKETQKVERSELKTLAYFANKFKVKNATLVYQGREEEIEVHGATIRKIPAWKLHLETSTTLQEDQQP